MSQPPFDVVGIGNAIVDVISSTTDRFLTDQGLHRGAMTLINAARAEELYRLMGPGTEASGGSVANTMAGIASLGGSGAYIGKVADDQLGTIFRHDMRSVGVRFDSPASTTGSPTARCLILVTPDGQRTMNTYLGACIELSPEDVDPTLIRAAKVTYLEGYLWDPPPAKQAFLKAAQIAHEASRKVSLTLSDPFCVDRHRAGFQDLVRNHVDILFANESEILSLYQSNTLDEAMAAVRSHCEVAVITRSEKGSLILSGGETHTVPAAPVQNVVDTTGAGDLYAAGFLYGWTKGMPLPACGRIASVAAAEVIGHYGPRPAVRLADLLGHTPA
ncbi:MAG: adenosine kinase [Pseudomonadota bacterium]|nr:adenosine kinase [Pseudomonadota bacterium]